MPSAELPMSRQPSNHRVVIEEVYVAERSLIIHVTPDYLTLSPGPLTRAATAHIDNYLVSIHFIPPSIV